MTSRDPPIWPDTPTFVHANLQNTTYGLGDLSSPWQNTSTSTVTPYIGMTTPVGLAALTPRRQQQMVWDADLEAQVLKKQQQSKEEPKVVVATGRRLVQVFISDPDENVPLDDCLLY